VEVFPTSNIRFIFSVSDTKVVKEIQERKNLFQGVEKKRMYQKVNILSFCFLTLTPSLPLNYKGKGVNL
jgi:hypothetical protein